MQGKFQKFTPQLGIRLIGTATSLHYYLPQPTKPSGSGALGAEYLYLGGKAKRTLLVPRPVW